jgi:FixJ family two-component response regulator
VVPQVWLIREAELPKKPLILIVDDDDAPRNAIKGLMRALGFRAEAFETAEDLLKSDRLRRAGCIIADMQMPHVSGLEMHRRLVGSGTSIPTILITAYPDDSVRTRALEAGIICYLTKPFSKKDLLTCIHSALAAIDCGQQGIRIDAICPGTPNAPINDALHGPFIVRVK